MSSNDELNVKILERVPHCILPKQKRHGSDFVLLEAFYSSVGVAPSEKQHQLFRRLGATVVVAVGSF